MIQKRRSAGEQTRASIKQSPDNHDQHSLQRRAELPIVHGYEYGPHRGRTQPVLIVEDCAHCTFSHFHRNPGGRRRLQRSCPVTGRSFILLPRVRRLRGGRRG